MPKVLRNITNNWFVFFGYFALFLLTIIAALQIYDSNYAITTKYKALANSATEKLMLLLRSRENLGSIQSIAVDKVFHPSDITPDQEIKLAQLQRENDDNFRK